jgi:solute carrier family 25 (mitochondrial thiamine pyrophosphate transporter), member 19
VAGAGGRLATAPLDLIRIRAQLERNVTYPRPSMWSSFVTIYQAEGGFLALFRGSVAATYLWIGYSVVQFAVYGRIKDHLVKVGGGGGNADCNNNSEAWKRWLNPTSIAFLSGAGAGVCATVSTYPFDICRTIFAARGVLPASPVSAVAAPAGSSGATAAATAAITDSFRPPTSLVECATAMYRQNGPTAFFAGIRPAVVQIIPYMGLNFAIYDSLTRGDRRIGLSGYAGSISGAVSKIVVYPMDTVKKRMQVQSVFGVGGGRHYYAGMWDCFSTMIRHEGVASLYRGLLPSVLKTSIGSGLSFSLFRMSKNVLEEIHNHFSLIRGS